MKLGMFRPEKSVNDEKQKAEPKTAGVKPEIIVSGEKGKPLFEIKYYNADDSRLHIGFGSYCLDLVFDWLKENFGQERACINEEETVPLKHARWLETEDSYAEPPKMQTCRCSACDCDSTRPLGEYCRWCGARMDLEEGEENADAADQGKVAAGNLGAEEV
jgi:hypothetical protein